MRSALLRRTAVTSAEHGAREVDAVVFNIQRYCVHDGPGIRTVVFLKACPLSCWWCANPESMQPRPEIGLARERCDGCGRCIAACPEGALSIGRDGHVELSRERCTACGRCVPACLPEAIAMYGTRMIVEDVFAEVSKDRIFYTGSQGGVTVSGGEPLLHPRFVAALFELCRRAGIGTAIETAGYYGPQVLRQVLPLTDAVLFDLKLMDPVAHQRFTGRPNHRILENARLVAASGIEVLFRMPLIPGINDSPENVRATAEFLGELGAGHRRIELLPYHRLAAGKLQALDRLNRMEGVQPPDSSQLQRIRAGFQDLGIRCTISE